MKAIALTLLLALGSSAALADASDRRYDPLARMQAQLDLTDQQVTQLEALFKEQRMQYRALRESTQAQMNVILTQEQQDAMAQHRAERQQKWKERQQRRQQNGEYRKKKQPSDR